ncbi:MAG: M23 family metallopeptidase [Ferruginibacter sp.]
MKHWKNYSFSNSAIFLLTGLFLLMQFQASSQIFPEKNYPQHYFRWPLDVKPGIAANFGELRPNHYHMGLDCRTDSKVNQPVYAAADGYIARVKIEPYGFGQCIYINHPNGLTTLYAHLNAFFPELGKYVKEQQYKLQSWKVFLDIPADMFPVTSGQQIALSGSTGGSQGPHVHFEIRDTKTDKVLNPLLFDMPIADNKAPDIFRLAVYDRRISVYEQSPKFYSLKKINGIYTTVPALLKLNTDKVSFAITAFDTYTGSSNRNGIYEASLYEDETPVVGFRIDSISYDETRDVNGHIDYKLRSSGGPFVQHLSRLPGYPEGVYKDVNGNGALQIGDDSVHHIRVEVKDANGNTSQLKFDVQSLYKTKNETDLSVHFNQKEFYPGYVNIFENDHLHFYLSDNQLYDSIRFTYNEIPSVAVSPIYVLKNANVPVHGYFSVSIKATVTENLSDKIVMEREYGGKNDFVKADNNNGWYKAAFREFGNFHLLIDTIPPFIKPVGFKDGMNCAKLTHIAFGVSDNTEEIKIFTAMLDGNWLRFSNDKGRTFIYTFDEMCTAGEHELKIYAEDQVGNVAERIYHFSR